MRKFLKGFYDRLRKIEEKNKIVDEWPVSRFEEMVRLMEASHKGATRESITGVMARKQDNFSLNNQKKEGETEDG